jgi:hypothetical protein
MDFMLMMGVAGENAKADYADSLDLFHTMEAYFTWYPNGGGRVSKYLLNKFLYTIDRDPDWSSGTAPTRAGPSHGGRPSRQASS